MSVSVQVSSASGNCVKTSCSKMGIFKVGETEVCRSHLRQVLDDALRPKVEVSSDLELEGLSNKELTLLLDGLEKIQAALAEKGVVIRSSRIEAVEREHRRRCDAIDIDGDKVVRCVCPEKPCAFCVLPLEDRLKTTGYCCEDDVDVPGLLCGHPLPCPRHLGDSA
jgi:hypothetical protein